MGVSDIVGYIHSLIENIRCGLWLCHDVGEKRGTKTKPLGDKTRPRGSLLVNSPLLYSNHLCRNLFPILLGLFFFTLLFSILLFSTLLFAAVHALLYSDSVPTKCLQQLSVRFCQTHF